MKKNPYVKTAGISLAIHAGFLFLLVVLGPMLNNSVSSATPIDVEFVPAGVIDTANTLNVDTSSSAAQEQPLNAEKISSDSAPQDTAAQSDKSNTNTAVIATSFSGAATVNLSNTVSTSSQQALNKAVVKRQASKVAGEKPFYPAAARSAGWEGTVSLLVVVGTDGSAQAVSVNNSSGYSALDDAANAAVKRWRFSPATRDGVPVESRTYVQVEFNLADGE